jgi:16S rRNA (guanine(966)-N(2))-methyltransferase RsmD
MAGAGRVVAGSARGVALVAPGPGTRPLADRVKQAVFGALEPHLAGSAVLDLCAGSGAAGIEALSRDAARAVLVDRDRAAAAAIAENLRRAGVEERAVVLRREALGALRDLAAAGERFDIAVVDPPYADTGLRDAILARLGASDGPLAPGATVVVTAHWRDLPAEAIGLLRSTRVRRFGETAIAFYRREAGGIAAAG